MKKNHFHIEGTEISHSRKTQITITGTAEDETLL